jgi:hypothetical protein
MAEHQFGNQNLQTQNRRAFVCLPCGRFFCQQIFLSSFGNLNVSLTVPRLLVLLILLSSFASLADSFQLGELRGGFYQPQANLEVVWSPTNELPKGLWTYTLAPQEFPAAAISNLMSALGFNWSNRTKFSDSHLKDKNLLFFADKKQNWTRYLEIAPTLGWIEYHGTPDNTAATNGVPDKPELERLAREIIFQLGIDSASLTDEHVGYEGVRGPLSKSGQGSTANLVSRGISFARRIDTARFGGMPSFMAIFGAHARLQSLAVSWPKLQPRIAYFALTPDDLVKLIKSGHATFPRQSCGIEDAESVTRLTVTDAGVIYTNQRPDGQLELSAPYVNLRIKVDTGGLNATEFFLQCPALSTNLFRGQVIK